MPNMCKVNLMIPQWMEERLTAIVAITGLTLSELIRVYMQTGMMCWDEFIGGKSCPVIEGLEGSAEIKRSNVMKGIGNRDDMLVVIDELNFRARLSTRERMKKIEDYFFLLDR